MEQFFDQLGNGHTDPRPFEFCPYCGTKLTGSDRVTCPTCSFVYHRNPLPGVSVLIHNGKRQVLLGRRRATPDLWCLPCGFIEWGENFIEGAHREVFEETGLAVHIGSVINVVSNIITPSLESLVIVLLAEPRSGEPTPGDDITELMWAGEGELPPLAFQADVAIISVFFARALSEIPVDRRFSR